EEIQEAAQAIELVALPVACTNEGKGAPLGMGIQRFWAQELAEAGVKAAAPVFTAMQEQNGRQAPALMIFREPWTDERALEGIARFANAQYGLATDMFAQEEKLTLTARLVAVKPGPALETVDTFVVETTAEALAGEIFAMGQKIAD